MGLIDSVHCEKFQCDFVEPTFALVAPVQPVLYRASCSNKAIQNASKHNKTHQNMSLGPTGWIGCIRCEKFLCDFVTKTFALIALVQLILHQASCSNETIQKAPKHYETQQYMSLGSNRVVQVHSLRKIPKRVHGTNLCI